MGTTCARAVRLTGGPGCVGCEARGRGRASRSASGGPAPCGVGSIPSPESGEGSGSGSRARPPAHAELFSSRQAALSSRGDSSCLISGWGGAGRRLTAGIAWHGHRPGRQRAIWQAALGGVHRPRSLVGHALRAEHLRRTRTSRGVGSAAAGRVRERAQLHCRR